MHQGRFGYARFGIGPHVFKINSFNSHACRSMQKGKFCNDREEELISFIFSAWWRAPLKKKKKKKMKKFFVPLAKTVKIIFLYHLRVWRVPLNKEMEKFFGSLAKTEEKNFICIFCGWWRAPSKEEKENIFVSPAKTVKMEFFFFVSSTRDPGVF